VHLQTQLLTILLITVTLLVADCLMPGLGQAADSLENVGKEDTDSRNLIAACAILCAGWGRESITSIDQPV
jgi:hypothetical protein